MITNKEVNNTKESQFDNAQSRYFENRQQQERRTSPSEGYAYISVVGWIDRREKFRRKKESIK
jgi:hypothetical protein